MNSCIHIFTSALRIYNTPRRKNIGCCVHKQDSSRGNDPGQLSLVEMHKEPLIRSASLRPKDLIENKFVNLIPQYLIGEHFGVASGALSQPLHGCFCQFVHAYWSQPLLTVHKQRPILWTERIINRWTTWLHEGRGSVTPPTRQETGAVG